MRIQLKEFIKLFTSFSVVRDCRVLWGKLKNRSYGLSGNYYTWNEAVRNSTGYDNEIILNKTKKALLKVKNGEAVYERDSVLFDNVQYAWPLLSCLMWVAAQAKGNLNVLDFGGSLGSTYFQNRVFLRHLSDVRWNIIEQPKYVETGKKWFEDDHLKFYLRVEDCLAETQPNVIILSGVLQYLERPYDVLSKFLNLSDCGYIIIDRTSFWSGAFDKLGVQSIDRCIFDASYPMWVFSLEKFLKALDSATIIESFPCFEDRLFGLQWKGFIVQLSKNEKI